MNSVEKVPPTVWVGESGVRRSGCASSIACSSRISRSYSRVGQRSARRARSSRTGPGRCCSTSSACRCRGVRVAVDLRHLIRPGRSGRPAAARTGQCTRGHVVGRRPGQPAGRCDDDLVDEPAARSRPEPAPQLPDRLDGSRDVRQEPGRRPPTAPAPASSTSPDSTASRARRRMSWPSSGEVDRDAGRAGPADQRRPAGRPRSSARRRATPDRARPGRAATSSASVSAPARPCCPPGGRSGRAPASTAGSDGSSSWSTGSRAGQPACARRRRAAAAPSASDGHQVADRPGVGEHRLAAGQLQRGRQRPRAGTPAP